MLVVLTYLASLNLFYRIIIIHPWYLNFVINACLTIQLKYNYTVFRFPIVVLLLPRSDFANIRRVKVLIFILLLLLLCDYVK